MQEEEKGEIDFFNGDFPELPTFNTNFGSTLSRSDKSIQPTTLIQLSGGIDSTFVLYDWLKNNPKEYCLVHHINNKNFEVRWQNESKAVKKILKWLDEKGLKNYLYLETTFDYGNLGWLLKDVELCAFHSAVIFRNLRWKNLRKLIVPLYKEEKHNKRFERATKLIGVLSVKPIEMQFPLYHSNKGETMQKLPKDLLSFCWYCRNPIGTKTCNTCKTCIEVSNINNKI